VNVSILGTQFQTPVARRTNFPVFNSKDATFDFPIYLSLSEKLCELEFVLWNKDMLGKEYLGEYALPLGEWFRGNVFSYDDLDNQVRLNILKSSPQKAGYYSLSFFPHTAILCQPHIYTRGD
jgi:hypothetical protein